MLKCVLLATLVLGWTAASSRAQGQHRPTQVAFADPQPHFVAAWAPDQERAAEGAAVLVRRVSLELVDVPLDLALKTLTNHANLRITYSIAVLPKARRVTIRARDVAVVTALTEILFRSGLDVVVDRDGTLALVACSHTALEREAQDTGAIVGRVTDKATGAPLAGAAVVVEGTEMITTTNAEGVYRLLALDAGVHTLRARLIGYAPMSKVASVSSNGETTLDFALLKSVPVLDELLTVTPGGMQTQARAIPTPVSVVSAADIEQRQPHDLNTLIREAVPTAVAFNAPHQVVTTSFSTRGASSLSSPGTLKIFVDGVESALSGLAAVDPASIDRIEVIRGPQAATVYGADAVSGVVQIFTKRGDVAQSRPQIGAQAQLGWQQTPYDGFGGVVRQQYLATMNGGSGNVSYNVGGSYSHLADFLPNEEISRQSSPSLYGGTRLTQGIVKIDLHARYFRNSVPQILNPELQTTGLAYFARPLFQPSSVTNQTYGGRITITPVSQWTNQLTVGADEAASTSEQVRRRLSTPSDTFLSVFSSTFRKRSAFFNSALKGQVSPSVGASLTVGVDHFSSDAGTFFTTQALNTSGTISVAPPGASTESRATVSNTGYFAQSEARWRENIYLTGGLRVENSSTFGEEVNAPVLPRVGLSLVQQAGAVTVKVRGAYGRAIRVPPAGAGFGEISSTLIVQPNPLLSPERQGGWDGGVDLVFAGRGTLSVTGFDQTAKDLIAFLLVGTSPLPTFQYQNVGRVSNRGVEVSGTLTPGPQFTLKAQYGFVRSRVEELGPGVTSEAQVQVGDPPLGVPAHTAGAAVTVTPVRGTTFNVGFSYLSSFRQLDILAQLRCFGGTGPCQSSPRGYIISYPGFVKVNASVVQRVTSYLDALLTVENLNNSEAHEYWNGYAVVGRLTMLGVRANW